MDVRENLTFFILGDDKFLITLGKQSCQVCNLVWPPANRSVPICKEAYSKVLSNITN